jgi:ubiquinone/menaquinone biosynthesis C-methylase UbiE
VDAIHRTATGFDTAADDYRRARPDYPDATVARLCDRLDVRPGRRVLDLGAGTGVLTRHLLARGADVVAAEPVAGMRRALLEAHPGAEVVAARAEVLPFRDGAVHAVTAAQAFHWFDAPRALAEIRRVLRPGGWLAVVFNIRDLEDPLQAALDDHLREDRADTPSWASREWDRALHQAAGFTTPEEHAEPHLHHLDADGFVARVASVSFVARLPDERRREVLAGARDLFHRHAVDGRVAMAYRAELSLLRRLDG